MQKYVNLFVKMRTLITICLCLQFVSVIAAPIIVNSENELLTALQNQNSSIELSSNIALTKSINIIHTSSITINGNGFSIDGQMQHLCFNISHSQNIILKSLHVQNCLGGFHVHQSVIDVSASHIQNNSAVSFIHILCNLTCYVLCLDFIIC